MPKILAAAFCNRNAVRGNNVPMHEGILQYGEAFESSRRERLYPPPARQR